MSCCRAAGQQSRASEPEASQTYLCWTNLVWSSWRNHCLCTLPVRHIFVLGSHLFKYFSFNRKKRLQNILTHLIHPICLWETYLLHEVLIPHHSHLLWDSFGHIHYKQVHSRFSSHYWCVVQVVRGPSINKCHNNPWMTSSRSKIRIEKVPYCMEYGLACAQSNKMWSKETTGLMQP